MTAGKAAFLLACISACATAVLKAEAPEMERGARPGLAYRVEGLDQVNLFNGTITTNIPLGQTYRVGGTLSYSFNASYATNGHDLASDRRHGQAVS